jgi:FkbM family methyltransferase
MRKLSQELRKIPAINYPLRTIFRAGARLFNSLAAHWRPSGIITFTYNGVEVKAFNRCDDVFVHGFYYNLEYHESNVLTITSTFAKRPGTILDIGANTGLDAIMVAKKHPWCKIIAIEPYEPNYKRLEKNIELNGVQNIEVLKVALGAENGMVEFTVPRDGRITDVASALDTVGEKVYPELEWKKVSVAQKTLDSLGLPEIKFFKCDVEGFEVNVLRGGTKFIRDNKPTFIVEIAVLSEEKINFFNEFAKENGYTIYLLNSEGLVKLEMFYEIDWRGDFLFTTYNSKHNFIPSHQLSYFVEEIV